MWSVDARRFRLGACTEAATAALRLVREMGPDEADMGENGCTRQVRIILETTICPVIWTFHASRDSVDIGVRDAQHGGERRSAPIVAA